MLEVFPNLQSLELAFRSTISWKKSPWRDHSHATWGAWEGLDRERYPCQKKLVDWIMTFAFEHIHHVPEVRLGGYFKTVAKTKWEIILNDKSLHDYSLAIQSEKAAICSLSATELQAQRSAVLLSCRVSKLMFRSPPECICPNPCEWIDGDFIDFFNSCRNGLLGRDCYDCHTKNPQSDEQRMEHIREA